MFSLDMVSKCQGIHPLFRGNSALDIWESHNDNVK